MLAGPVEEMHAQAGQHLGHLTCDSTIGTKSSAGGVNGQWMVDQADLDAELEEHRAARTELDRITKDYATRILHGEVGSTIRTTFGSYTIYADFHSI